MSIVGAFMVPHPPLIIPTVGRGGEEQIKKTTESYMKVAEEIAKLKPETIIISSPHTTVYSDYFHISPGSKATGSFAHFGAPETKFEETYDEEFVKELENLANTKKIPAGTYGEQDPSLDHGTMVPLYFIRQKYNDFKIVRIGISGLPLVDHYKVGELIQEITNKLNRRVVYVASGDLSHKLQANGPYGFAPEGPVYDEKIMDVCSRASFKDPSSSPPTPCRKCATSRCSPSSSPSNGAPPHTSSRTVFSAR